MAPRNAPYAPTRPQPRPAAHKAPPPPFLPFIGTWAVVLIGLMLIDGYYFPGT